MNSLEKGFYVSMIVIFMAFAAIISITLWWPRSSDAGEQSTTPASAVSNDYQVKIFYLHRLNVDTAEEMERRITAWLKENKAKPISISQSCGASIHGAAESTLVITVLYRTSQ